MLHGFWIDLRWFLMHFGWIFVGFWIDHRTVCGNKFSVKDGAVQKKLYEYGCPVCKRHVSSNVQTGQVDHRTVCGSHFSVKNGIVTATRRKPRRKKKQEMNLRAAKRQA